LAVRAARQAERAPLVGRDLASLVAAQHHGEFGDVGLALEGETAAAQVALEASWKINQSLRERPEFLSQMVALSVLDLQTGALRKMEHVPDIWQKRIGLAAWQESFWRAMELDAMVNSRDMTDTDAPVRSTSWFDLLVKSPFGRPVRCLVGIEIVEASHEALAAIRTNNFCVLSPHSAVEQLAGSRSTWSLGTQYGYTNYLRAWSAWMEAMTRVELTAKILQAKEARNSVATRDWPEQLKEMNSLLCPEAKWVHEITPDGSIKLQCLNLPEWLRKGFPQSVPLTYSLRAKS